MSKPCILPSLSQWHTHTHILVFLAHIDDIDCANAQAGPTSAKVTGPAGPRNVAIYNLARSLGFERLFLLGQILKINRKQGWAMWRPSSCSVSPKIWLVVKLPLWKMMEFVSWDDDIPNIWKTCSKCSKPPTRYLCVAHLGFQGWTLVLLVIPIFSNINPVLINYRGIATHTQRWWSCQWNLNGSGFPS